LEAVESVVRREVVLRVEQEDLREALVETVEVVVHKVGEVGMKG